ncbi:fibrinogen C domain-containing protein 1-like [Dysidea avara]|uniref:fibrinogen C domain-containing protein 1-like n=1 Tax=Dysidea avara TaxID=196820 RepID=UPI0033311014
MTIATTILLLVLIIVPLSSGQQANSDDGTRLINNCCNLGYGRFTFSKNIRRSGIYVIPNVCRDDHLKAEAYCDTINGGGGWLVVQRRQDGSVDFNRTWVEYEDGFGELTGEFWYGLRALHCLTGQGGWEMRMDIKLANGTEVVLHYDEFTVAPAIDKYKLTVGGFQGTTTNPMAVRHNEMSFTTKDSDNDQHRRNCALAQGPSRPAGGWWFKDCWHIAPNLFYEDRANGIYINDQWPGLVFIEIKIRPFQCSI